MHGADRDALEAVLEVPGQLRTSRVVVAGRDTTRAGEPAHAHCYRWQYHRKAPGIASPTMCRSSRRYARSYPLHSRSLGMHSLQRPADSHCRSWCPSSLTRPPGRSERCFPSRSAHSRVAGVALPARAVAAVGAGAVRPATAIGAAGLESRPGARLRHPASRRCTRAEWCCIPGRNSAGPSAFHPPCIPGGCCRCTSGCSGCSRCTRSAWCCTRNCRPSSWSPFPRRYTRPAHFRRRCGCSGLHVLHSNRTALHPCSQAVLVTAPSLPHTCSIAPMQVLLGTPQPEGPTSARRPGVSAGDPVIASGGGGPSVSLC